MRQSLAIMPHCDGTHTRNKLVKRSNPTPEAAWCGEWYDCPVCHFSMLIMSGALLQFLEQQVVSFGYASYKDFLVQTNQLRR